MSDVEIPDFGPDHADDRRNFLSMLATEHDLLESLTESMETDATPMAIRAIAMELTVTSIKLHSDVMDRLGDVETALELVGPMMAGLLGFGEESSIEPPEDEDPKVTALHQKSRRTGAQIREGAGLETSRADPESRTELIEQGRDLVRRLRREADELEQQANEMEAEIETGEEAGP